MEWCAKRPGGGVIDIRGKCNCASANHRWQKTMQASLELERGQLVGRGTIELIQMRQRGIVLGALEVVTEGTSQRETARRMSEIVGEVSGRTLLL
jgi:hypothetical protein